MHFQLHGLIIDVLVAIDIDSWMPFVFYRGRSTLSMPKFSHWRISLKSKSHQNGSGELLVVWRYCVGSL